MSSDHTTRNVLHLLSERRGFRSLLIRTGISKLGSAVSGFAIPLIILQRTGSPWNMAFGVLFNCAPHFLFGPVLGTLADRLDRRRLLIGTDASQIVLTLALGVYLALFPHSTSVWPLYVAGFIRTSLDVAYWVVAEFCVVPGLVAPDELGPANSAYFAMSTGADICGPVVGGFLLALGHPATVFIVDALSFLATLLLWVGLPREAFGQTAAGIGAGNASVAEVMAGVRRSVRTFFGHPVLAPLFAALCLSVLGTAHRGNVLIYHWRQSMGLAPEQVGLRVSLLSAVSIVGNLISPWLTRLAGEGHLFLAHWTMSVLLAMALGTGRGGEVFLIGAVLMMELMGSAVWIYTFHARQVLVPREGMAGVNSVARAALLGSVSLSNLIYLPLVERIGVHATMALSAGPLLMALGIWLYRPRLLSMRLAPTRARSEAVAVDALGAATRPAA